MVPAFVVTVFPAMVRYDDDRNVEGANRAVERAQVVEQADLLGDRLDQGKDLAAFREEIVVGIDQQIGGPVERIKGVRHDDVLHKS
ncbi:hypothetical protein D3C84_590470 [compost metagenome]